MYKVFQFKDYKRKRKWRYYRGHTVLKPVVFLFETKSPFNKGTMERRWLHLYWNQTAIRSLKQGRIFLYRNICVVNHLCKYWKKNLKWFFNQMNYLIILTLFVDQNTSSCVYQQDCWSCRIMPKQLIQLIYWYPILTFTLCNHNIFLKHFHARDLD